MRAFLFKPRRLPGFRGRKPDAQEVRRQWVDLFIVSIFAFAGVMSAFLLLRSAGFAHMLGVEKSSDRHVVVSYTIAVVLAAVLTIARLWICTRRMKKGDNAA
jgi:hypothetical protein